MEVIVDENLYDLRLDAYLAEKFDRTRNHFDILIKDSKVKVNDVVVTKSAYKTKINDKITIEDNIKNRLHSLWLFYL